jgi:hypothetical protein
VSTEGEGAIRSVEDSARGVQEGERREISSPELHNQLCMQDETNSMILFIFQYGLNLFI